MSTRVGIGTSCHRFLSAETSKPCIIAGIIFEDIPGFQATSDGDVVFYALCNAITSLTHVQIIGGISEKLFTHEGITDSEIYLKEALKTLQQARIVHIAISLEGKRPLFNEHFMAMRKKLADTCKIGVEQVGITAIAGDGLTDCSCGEGVYCTTVVTVQD